MFKYLQSPSQTALRTFSAEGRTSHGLGARLPEVLGHANNIFFFHM